MPNINLIGTEPDQIPTNADLGTLAFQDQDYVNVGNLIVATADITTEARIARFSTANARITGGSVTGITGSATFWLVSTGLSAANVQLTGTASSWMRGVPIETANLVASGGSIGTTAAGAVSRVANVYAILGNFTNFSTANALITGGSITGVTGAASTLLVTNFSTANGYITGTSSSIGTLVSGALDRVANVYAVLGNFTDSSIANAVITGGSATHLVATNFSTANALITGGSITGGTGAFTTLTATNFSSGNVTSITGGAGTFVATNFSSGNISITGGNIILAPGLAGKAPLQFSTGGTLHSSAAAGMFEYTTLFHGTTQGTERGLVPTPQIFVLNADRGLATVTTTQTLFNQTFKVTAGTRYYYEAFISISKQNATANTLQYAIVVATAVIASHEYSVISKVAAARTTVTAPVQMSNRITTGFNTLVDISSASAAAAATFDAHIQGYFDITTGGTINPQIALATNATTTPLLLAQSYWLMYPVGSATANTSIQ